jgi:ribonuclease Z
MKILKSKLFIISICALIVLGVGAYYVISNPPAFIIDMVAKRTMSKRKLQVEDGLHAFLAGTGAPMPDLKRAGPSTVVIAGDKIFMVDTGEATARNMQLVGINMGKIDAVFLTHFHSDHIAGLGETMLQRWATGENTKPLSVIGPVGTKEVLAGFTAAYQHDKGYRIAHHGEDVMVPSAFGGTAKEFDLGTDPMSNAVVYDKDGVKITAFNVNHKPVYPAVGYKFEYGGRSLVISGDTAYCDNLFEQSKGVDLLVCEALNSKFADAITRNAAYSGTPTAGAISKDIQTYHISPEQAAQLAQTAGIRNLTLTHILPPNPSPLLKNVFLGDATKIYKGKIDLGRDGLLISLPSNSSKITKKYLLD